MVMHPLVGVTVKGKLDQACDGFYVGISSEIAHSAMKVKAEKIPFWNLVWVLLTLG